MLTMTYDDISALIASGDWKEEIIAESEEQEFTKNINKFQYFTLEAYYTNTEGEETLCGRFFFSRDYINKWQIKDGNYSMSGNFGDGSKLVITDRTIDEAGAYNNIYIKRVHGYRPVRKTIYVYKVDPSIYLLSSDSELLLTSEGLALTVLSEDEVPMNPQ